MILHLFCLPGVGGGVVELEYRTINVYRSETVDDHGPKLGDLSTQLGSGFSESFETQAGTGSYGLWKTRVRRRHHTVGTPRLELGLEEVVEALAWERNLTLAMSQ